jgi:hypothetical protein
MTEPNVDALAEAAVNFCDEIERNERELIDSGWGGYQWEHLGDATKDIHVLIRHIRELAALARANTEQATLLHDAMDALEAVAWKDSDGLCWCPGETEFAVAHPNSDHTPRCLAARDLLARFRALTGGS